MNLEPGIEEAATEEQYLLAFFPLLAYPAFLYNPDTYSEVKPSTVDWPLNYQSTINKTCPTGLLTNQSEEGISQLSFPPLPNDPSLCQVDKKKLTIT